MHIPLVILGKVGSCEGCGACCTHIGTPPGYAPFFPIRGKIPADWKRSPDWAIFRTLPKYIKDGLRWYYKAVWAGKIQDRSANDNTPCLWYNPATRKCIHHEHRPTVCREFEIGGELCLRHRERVGIV